MGVSVCVVYINCHKYYNSVFDNKLTRKLLYCECITKSKNQYFHIPTIVSNANLPVNVNNPPFWSLWPGLSRPAECTATGARLALSEWLVGRCCRMHG